MQFIRLDLPGLIILAAALIVYFMPWYIAALREHPRHFMIGLLNLLLGWTVVGWVGVFFWAVGDVRAPVEHKEELEAEKPQESPVEEQPRMRTAAGRGS